MTQVPQMKISHDSPCETNGIHFVMTAECPCVIVACRIDHHPYLHIPSYPLRHLIERDYQFWTSADYGASRLS